jgi:hypothetical protein
MICGQSYIPSFPIGSLEVVVEPTEKNLIWRKTQEFIKSFSVFEQTIQFRVKFNIDLAKQTTLDDLPDKTENQVLTAFNKIL